MDAKAKFNKKIEDLNREFKGMKFGFIVFIEYQKNNEVIEELKRQHAKELADHVRESNKKYNGLLQEKLDSEDALRIQFDKDMAALKAEYEKKLKEAFERGRSEERKAAEQKIEQIRLDFDKKIDNQIARNKKLEESNMYLKEEIKEKIGIYEEKLGDKDEEIA